MSYVNQGQFQKRRPSVKCIEVDSIEKAKQVANEAIHKANQRIAEIKTLANKQTAEFEAWADHCELQARIAWEENQTLRQQVADLERENARLRKLAGRKAGKRKGEEWEE